MNSVLDGGLVGLVLAVSVAYAAYSLGPRAWRPRMLGLAATALGRLPSFPGLRSVARRLEAASALQPKVACGGCDNCGSEPAAPGPSSAAGPSGAPAEISVPLSKIRKRTVG